MYCRIVFVGTAILLGSSFALAAEIGQPEICKAAIAAMMGGDPATMRTDQQKNGVTYFSYVRADDGSVWSYRCKLSGNLVIWASETGPWRDRLGDEKVTYVLAPDRSQVSIKQEFADGSNIKAEFSASQFK